MVRYVEIFDNANMEEPKGENIAKELEKTIAEIEKEGNVKLISACFLGETEVFDEDPGLLKLLVQGNVAHMYMLFFN